MRNNEIDIRKNKIQEVVRLMNDIETSGDPCININETIDFAIDLTMAIEKKDFEILNSYISGLFDRYSETDEKSTQEDIKVAMKKLLEILIDPKEQE